MVGSTLIKLRSVDTLAANSPKAHKPSTSKSSNKCLNLFINNFLRNIITITNITHIFFFVQSNNQTTNTIIRRSMLPAAGFQISTIIWEQHGNNGINHPHGFSNIITTKLLKRINQWIKTLERLGTIRLNCTTSNPCFRSRIIEFTKQFHFRVCRKNIPWIIRSNHKSKITSI